MKVNITIKLLRFYEIFSYTVSCMIMQESITQKLLYSAIFLFKKLSFLKINLVKVFTFLLSVGWFLVRSITDLEAYEISAPGTSAEMLWYLRQTQVTGEGYLISRLKIHGKISFFEFLVSSYGMIIEKSAPQPQSLFCFEVSALN